MKVIKYEVKDSYCKTECPMDGIRVRVQSTSCQDCKNYILKIPFVKKIICSGKS